MKHSIFLVIMLLASIAANAQTDKQLLISVHYRQLDETYIGKRHTFTYNFNPMEIQLAYRDRIKQSEFLLTYGVTYNKYYSNNIVYPHSELYYLEDVRMYGSLETKATLIRPSLLIQREFVAEKIAASAGLRVFGTFGLDKSSKLDSRVEYYDYDSLGNMNSQPDTVMYSHEDWHKDDFYIYPTVGIELVCGFAYSLTPRFSAFGEGAIGIAKGPKADPVAMTRSFGIGIAIAIGEIQSP